MTMIAGLNLDGCYRMRKETIEQVTQDHYLQDTGSETDSANDLQNAGTDGGKIQADTDHASDSSP